MFFSPAGDHYRTRLTHTLEVSQIARTIAKVLRLHEELTEAIALGHDLGHTPFGHAGERVLDSLVPGGFNHYEQSLRVVDVLEGDGRGGLNLTWEVRNGIAKHSKGKHGLPVGSPPEHRSATVEGQIARVADIIAYVNHDIDDAVRAGVLRPEDLPAGPVAILGQSSSQRIGRMVTDVVVQTLAVDVSEIRMSDDVLGAMLALRDFLFARGLRERRRHRRVQEGGRHPRRPVGEGPRAPGGVPGHRDHRGGGPRRGHPRLRGGDDRPLRRPALREAVHPHALGRAPGVSVASRRRSPTRGIVSGDRDRATRAAGVSRSALGQCRCQPRAGPLHVTLRGLLPGF